MSVKVEKMVLVKIAIDNMLRNEVYKFVRIFFCCLSILLKFGECLKFCDDIVVLVVLGKFFYNIGVIGLLKYFLLVLKCL